MNYHKLKFSVEWQMKRWNISEEEAIDKITKMKKSFGISRPYSIEWQMKKWNISKEEAILRIENSKNKTRNTQKSMSDFDFKAMSPKNPEHWIKKGFQKDEANDIAKKQVKDMQLSCIIKRKEHPENYKASYNTNIDYYIKKGFSEDEAIEMVKNRQATGRLDKFIERYGEKEGTKKWRERQVKWQKTLQEKPQCEKDRINKLKGNTLENMITKWGKVDGTEKYNNWLNRINKFYSNISQQLFYKLLENIIDKENVKFTTHNGEKVIQQKNNCYLYDFCYKRKIIEFNGDKWHANPILFNENDMPNPYIKITSKEIWEHDKIKNNIAKDKGYKILIVWESDYIKNEQKIINECLNYLTDEN